jgi:ABC-type dipeptide/oligopeptide/nickel transport system permease component
MLLYALKRLLYATPVAIGVSILCFMLVHIAPGDPLAAILPADASVMGQQLGYLLGGSILIETVFSWPGTGFLLNAAIFQRDLPLLQGTILVLAMFFVLLNLVVDVVQTALDPRIKRG